MFKSLFLITFLVMLTGCGGSSKSSEVEADNEIILRIDVDWQSSVGLDEEPQRKLKFYFSLKAATDDGINYIEVENEDEFVLFINNDQDDLLDAGRKELLTGSVAYRTEYQALDNSEKEIRVEYKANGVYRTVEFTIPQQIEANLDAAVTNSYDPQQNDLLLEWTTGIPLTAINLYIDKDPNKQYKVPYCSAKLYSYDPQENQFKHTIAAGSLDDYECVTEENLYLVFHSNQGSLIEKYNEFEHVNINFTQKHESFINIDLGD